MRARSTLSLLPLVLLLTRAAPAATLTVGPGKAYAKPCAAIAVAKPGDVIEVDAGNYDGDTCAWSTDDLTVRGVGGRAKIDLKGVAPTQKKGIFTIYAPNATVENFELSGAAISAADGNNGAGIRHQGTNLTVRGCVFHDDQDGILGGPPTEGTGQVLIESSEFYGNGAGDGQSHNMYLNHYARFTLRESYSHGAKVGHLVKTRASVNTIAYNRLTDEAGTTASYEIDVPNGGTTLIVGNLIEQSNESQNGAIVEYGLEGATNADQHVWFVHNTVVNDRVAGGTFLMLAPTTTATVTDNIFKGKGTVCSLGTATLSHNWTDAQGDPMLVAPGTFDFRLAKGSPCIDQGVDPGFASGNVPLAPDRQYVHPTRSESRGVAGAAPDLGAYELGWSGPATDAGLGADAGPHPADDAGSALQDAGGTTGDAGGSVATTAEDGGCACDTSALGRSGSASGGAMAVAAGLALARRRRRGSSTA